MLVGIVTAFVVVILDQLSKALVYGYLDDAGAMVTVSSYFNLVTAWNRGVSFSMFDNLGGYGVYVLSAFALTVVAILLYWLKHEEGRLMQFALGFVIGGAIGNVIDRIRLGAVFDFLDVHIAEHHWPAFNLADSFICIGACLIILSSVCTCSPRKIKRSIQTQERDI